MNVFVRVLQRRETLSLGPRPGKTAQKPLKSCLKNRSKITARNERFFKQDLSGLRGFSKKKPPKPPKPLKPLISCWKTAQTAQILSGFRAESRPGKGIFLKRIVLKFISAYPKKTLRTECAVVWSNLVWSNLVWFACCMTIAKNDSN